MDDEAHARIARGEPGGDGHGVVAAAVVDHDDLVRDRATRGRIRRSADGVGEVLGLVEARQHDGQAAEGIG